MIERTSPELQTEHQVHWEYGAVFIGGAAGSIVRELFVPIVPAFEWVTATFVVNMIACLILGWLYAVRHRLHAHIVHLSAVGFCGGLSTFSTYAAEIYDIVLSGAYVNAFRASMLEIACGIGVALLGEVIGRRYHSGESR